MLEIISRVVMIISTPFQWLARTLGIQSIMSQASTTRAYLGGFTQFFREGSPLADVRDSIEAWREEREFARQAREEGPALYRPEAADYSQIHLIHTDQRIVLHVGAATRSMQAATTLREGSDHPLTLTFRRVNDTVYGAPFTLTIAGECEAAIDGRQMHGETPIKHRSRLNIDEVDYTVEFFAWQALAFAPRLDVGWHTHKGPVRHINEDAIGIAKSPYGHFFAVADGVGGGERGDLVSEYAVRYMLTVFERNIRYDYDWADVIRRALQNMNQEVRHFGMQSQAMSGTTLTMVVVRGWDAVVGHIGDSCLYLVSGGTVTKVTTDHVRVVRRSAQSVDSPLPAQLERNILTHAIGKDDTIEPQITTLRLQPGDYLLLATDGISLRVKEEELLSLTSVYRPSSLPEHLAALANQRFNADNVSAICVYIRPNERRGLWRPVPSERVYTTGAAPQALHLSAPLVMQTNYQRRARRTTALAWLLLIAALAAIVVILSYRQQLLTALEPLPATATATLTRTPLPTATPTPLPATATPTPSSTPTLTSVPPTSTLAPLPTSTLAPLPPRRQPAPRKG